MRLRTRAIAASALTVLAVAGCGGSSSKPSDLFSEYLKASEVKNNTFNNDPNGTDRLESVAAQLLGGDVPPSSEELRAVLLSPYSCDDYYNGPPSPDCDPGEATEAVDKAAGSDGQTHARSILAKRENGTLELVTVFVVRDGDDKAVLIDNTGQTYRGGLADFRANNSLFTADDWILAPVDITAVPPGDEPPRQIETTTVPGHTPGTWGWWAGGGGVVVVLIVGVLWFIWTPRAKHRAPDNSDAGMLRSL